LTGMQYAIRGEAFCERICDDSGCPPGKSVVTEPVLVASSDEGLSDVTLTFERSGCEQ